MPYVQVTVHMQYRHTSQQDRLTVYHSEGFYPQNNPQSFLPAQPMQGDILPHQTPAMQAIQTESLSNYETPHPLPSQVKKHKNERVSLL